MLVFLRLMPMFIVAIFACEPQSRAAEIVSNEAMAVQLPLEAAVAKASRVARVRIERRTPLLYGGSQICGYTYSARVISDLKGGSQSFEFAMSDDDDFLGFDVDYLLIAFSREGR